MPASPSSVAEKKSVCRFGRAQRDDAVERRAEAHVEHAVGLVDHQRAHVVEVEGATLELVLEPARRGDDDVGLGGGLRLLEQADTAVDGA